MDSHDTPVVDGGSSSSSLASARRPVGGGTDGGCTCTTVDRGGGGGGGGNAIVVGTAAGATAAVGAAYAGHDVDDADVDGCSTSSPTSYPLLSSALSALSQRNIRRKSMDTI